MTEIEAHFALDPDGTASLTLPVRVFPYTRVTQRSIHGVQRHGDYVQWVASARALAVMVIGDKADGVLPYTGAVSVDMIIGLAEKRRADLSNLFKGAEDAMNAVLWEDDKQVEQIVCRTWCADEPWLSVVVKPVAVPVA